MDTVEPQLNTLTNGYNHCLEKSLGKILYLNNPDVVYYSELDIMIKDSLIQKGFSVLSANLEDISFDIKTEEIKLFINNEETVVDAFLFYGYMSGFHHEAFMFIIETFEAMKIVCLHSPSNERILSNKYLQALKYSQAQIPIPKTSQGYSIKSFKDIGKRNFQNKKSILKKLEEYGGDGVKRCDTKESMIGTASKLLWNNEYSLCQDYVKDSVGRSIRVFCINQKAIAIAEYVDKSDNYISNISYREFFELRSLMDHPKYNIYAELGERAVKSISNNLFVGGVDILDSEENGMVVLEVNGFPDIYDLCESTKVDVFGLLAEAFKNKILQNKKK